MKSVVLQDLIIHAVSYNEITGRKDVYLGNTFRITCIQSASTRARIDSVRHISQRILSKRYGIRGKDMSFFDIDYFRINGEFSECRSSICDCNFLQRTTNELRYLFSARNHLGWRGFHISEKANRELLCSLYITYWIDL